LRGRAGARERQVAVQAPQGLQRVAGQPRAVLSGAGREGSAHAAGAVGPEPGVPRFRPGRCLLRAGLRTDALLRGLYGCTVPRMSLRVPPTGFRGRGALSNPPNRHDSQRAEAVDDGWYQEELADSVATTVLPEPARSVITYNDSPDIPFDRSINPYRGCEHGCPYCFARPSHAYLGLSPGLDFETRLFYKADAAKLLRQELAKKAYTPQPIMFGANTDPYQPLERRLGITRSLLEVLLEHRHPAYV